MARGGKREGAGRKPKAEELKLIEVMDSILEDQRALEELASLVKRGNFSAIKLWLEYRYGKPKDHIEQSTREEIELPPWVRTLQIEYVDPKDHYVDPKDPS